MSQSVGHDLEKDATFTAREDFFLNQDTAPELEHIPIVTNVWKATYNEKRIYSFAWAPTPSPSSAFVNSHKLIVLGNKAKYEKIRILTGHAFSVSSLSHICISNGQHVRESALMPPGVEDIGDIMYRRACTGYSLYAHKNIEILEESSLREVWGWIAGMS